MRVCWSANELFNWPYLYLLSWQRLLKWYLIPPCLPLGNIRHVLRVKWSNPGKVVAPSPTPRCGSYWKGSLLVTLDYGRQILNRLISLVCWVLARGPGDLGSILGRVIPKILKMGLDTSLITTQQDKARIKGKMEPSRESNSTLPYTSVL